MAVSKVVLGDETLVDLTSDTVSEDTLLAGTTAHAANGEQITGGVVVTPMYTGTKAAIEEAIALGQIPEDAVVNITDDEETSSFQTQINEINSSIGDISGFITDTYDSIGAYIQYCVDNGYLPDIDRLPLIPTMTSNTTPSGIASASDEATYNEIKYYAYHAFADDSLWWHSGQSVTPIWISYKFDTPKVVKKFTLENVYDESTGFVNSFKLQASNDNSTWVDLDTYTNSNVKGAKSTFNVSNESSYLYYRIYVVSIHDSIGYARIKRIQMYGS